MKISDRVDNYSYEVFKYYLPSLYIHEILKFVKRNMDLFQTNRKFHGYEIGNRSALILNKHHLGNDIRG